MRKIQLFDARIVAKESSQAEVLRGRGCFFNQNRLTTREAEKLSAEARAGLAEAVGVSVRAFDSANKARISFVGWTPAIASE